MSFLKDQAKTAASSQAQLYSISSQSVLSIAWLPEPKESLSWGPGFGLGLPKQRFDLLNRVPSGLAIHVASSFGLTPFVKLLLDGKHPPDDVEGAGMTPLSYAASIGEGELITLL
jgi:ankyrin repeat protein